MRVAKPHAALLASPGIGHLIPMLELGKRLINHHGFDATVFIVSTDPSTTHSQLQQQPSNLKSLTVVVLPQVDISKHLAPDASFMARLVLTMQESMPLLRSAIVSMPVQPTALIVDIFGTMAFNMAKQLGMPRYIFVTTNAWFLAVTAQATVLDEEAKNKHVKDREPLPVPGCKPVQYEDTMEPFTPGHELDFMGFVACGCDILVADGILVNTWNDLEPTTLAALRDPEALGRVVKTRVYPVGPLVRVVPISEPRGSNKVIDWLESQPSESVLYVSFGSAGNLSPKQIIELAWGLELSQQRFIWVVRPPIEDDASAYLFSVGSDRDGNLDFLPDGFVTRTNGLGLVVLNWASQAEILAHPSVGGLLSHCGWNSTLESLTNGVPMIGWPLFAEQKMNAAMLTEELGVSVRARATGDVVGREEIERLVRTIMVEKKGKRMKERVKEVKRSGEKASSEGGSSYNSLSEFARECEIHLQNLLSANALGA